MGHNHGKFGHRFFKHAIPAPPMNAGTTTGKSSSFSKSGSKSFSKSCSKD